MTAPRPRSPERVTSYSVRETDCLTLEYRIRHEPTFGVRVHGAMLTGTGCQSGSMSKLSEITKRTMTAVSRSSMAMSSRPLS